MCDASSTASIEPISIESYRLLRQTSGLARLSDVRVVELRGEDRLAWLQGQATQDLRGLTPGTARAFCLCSPTGQLTAICQVWALPQRLILTTPLACLPEVLGRIDRMVVMEDVTGCEAPWAIWSVQGPTASRSLSAILTLPSLDSGEAELGGSLVITLRSDRTGMGGWDVLAHASSCVGNVLAEAFSTIDSATWRMAELEAGLPKFGVDTDAKTLPPELGPAFEGGHVSYGKGCYTGQEVLMRLHSRGHTNRTWRGLLSDKLVSPGDRVAHSARADAGAVTSAAISPELGPIAAAMLRNEAAEPGDWVIVHTEGGPVEAEVVRLPFRGR